MAIDQASEDSGSQTWANHSALQFVHGQTASVRAVMSISVPYGAFLSRHRVRTASRSRAEKRPSRETARGLCAQQQTADGIVREGSPGPKSSSTTSPLRGDAKEVQGGIGHVEGSRPRAMKKGFRRSEVRPRCPATPGRVPGWETEGPVSFCLA